MYWLYDAHSFKTMMQDPYLTEDSVEARPKDSQIKIAKSLTSSIL